MTYNRDKKTADAPVISAAASQTGSTLIAKANRLRILIVEDSSDSAEILERALTLLGMRVEIARNGTEALTVAKGFKPDAVLLDIGLPGIDGIHVAKELKKQTDSPLIIAVTGRSAPDDILRSMDAGIDHHLVKPLVILSLVEILHAIVHGRR